MQEALVAYLEEQQAALGLPSWEMAARLGISESNWGHIRRSRRRLSPRVLEKAAGAFPGIVRLIGQPEQPAAVAS